MAATTDQEERVIREAAEQAVIPQVKPVARASIRPALLAAFAIAAGLGVSNYTAGSTPAEAFGSAAVMFLVAAPALYALWILFALGQVAEAAKKRARSEIAAAKMPPESDSKSA